MTNEVRHSIWLLDTNIISHVMKHPQGQVAQALATLKVLQPASIICTSVVVSCELQFGFAKNNAQKLQLAYQNCQSLFHIYPLDDRAALHYAKLRVELERAGTSIGANDMLIAAQALALDATLVTNNEEEFRRIPQLKLANWLKDAPSRTSHAPHVHP